MKEYRCKQCNKLLFKGKYFGIIEILCNRCKQINKIDLKIDYITDKLLDENESLKEDILEILGIYKNTSSNRERVNEQELIIANSLTTVNKLGLEDSLKILFNEIESVLGFKYSVDLNINKIFDVMKGDE